MEELEELENKQGREAGELINVLHRMHCDNSKLQYYARKISGPDISIMPLTPFVYEFFLFNSLYQVDWVQTSSKVKLIYHPDDYKELKKQRKFISFLKQHAKKTPRDILRAFEPLLHIERTEGPWTKVTPDSRITISDGEKFFERICRIQDLLEENSQAPSNISVTSEFYEDLEKCKDFIYLVRNNVFHGSKSLGEVYEPSQKRRIEIYELFLKGLTSLFFLAQGKESAACDFVPNPISSSSVPNIYGHEVMDQSLVLTAANQHLMKLGDSRLVARLTKNIPPPSCDFTPGSRSSLFYPSAGTDFITPILLGLPYCTQFFFYERFNSMKGKEQINKIARLLRRIKGVSFHTTGQPRWESNGVRDYLDFEFNGIPRRLHWVHDDNMAFLRQDAELRFYFHRGDSEGEGGSGQEWDSRLLPELLKVIPADSSCIFMTDGFPGGIDTQYAKKIFQFDVPICEREKTTYYCGRFSSLS